MIILKAMTRVGEDFALIEEFYADEAHDWSQMDGEAVADLVAIVLEREGYDLSNGWTLYHYLATQETVTSPTVDFQLGHSGSAPG